MTCCTLIIFLFRILYLALATTLRIAVLSVAILWFKCLTCTRNNAFLYIRFALFADWILCLRFYFVSSSR